MDEKVQKFRGKEIIFLFDTNVYRRLIEMNENSRETRTNMLLFQMHIHERENNCRVMRSLTTSQELISHLIEGDDSFGLCMEALKFQERHTQFEEKGLNSPSIDLLLLVFLYEEDVILNKNDVIISTLDKYRNYTDWLKHTIKKIVKIPHDSNVQKEIEKIKRNFSSYKKEFHELISRLLNSPSNTENEWDFFYKDKELISFIADSRYLTFMKNYFVERTELLSGTENKISDEKIIEFGHVFKEALLHFRYLFTVLRQSGNQLKDITNNPWNFINDFQIVFEWCFVKYYYREKNIEIVLVTEDKSGNFKTPIEKKEKEKKEIVFESMHDLNDNVWYTWQYFEFIGYNVDKSNPNKKIVKDRNGWVVQGVVT